MSLNKDPAFWGVAETLVVLAVKFELEEEFPATIRGGDVGVNLFPGKFWVW